MFTRRSKKSKQTYTAPKSRIHRSFVYLNDDIAINSLSALESGKVDEVVEKINLAQERGLSIGLKVGVGGASGSGEGGRKDTESLQAEVIRRRTRFSVFELWYEALQARNAIGTFMGWGADALDGVAPGQIVEITGKVQVVPLQTGLRMYLWFVNQVRDKNPLFTDGVNLNDLVGPEKIVKFLLGKHDEVNATITPLGGGGPTVAISFHSEWLIGEIGRWNGTYTVLAQVEEVLASGDKWPTMRIIEDAPLSPLEATTLTNAVEPFRTALEGLGIELDESPTEIGGPALVLQPIAMFR